MLRPLLIGLTAGLRSMTPLALVSLAARSGRMPAAHLLGNRLLAGGSTALAVGELIGDKWSKAPDRIVLPGLAARLVTGGLAGAAVSGRSPRLLGAALGAGGAIAGAYLGFTVRKAAMRRFGQTSSGLVEDAIALASAALLVRSARLPRSA